MAFSVTLGPPFGILQTMPGAPAADASALSDGRIAASGWSYGAGSNRRWALAGNFLFPPDDSRSLTVTTTVSVRWRLDAVAYFGYASAEVLVNLWTWGSNFGVQEDRRSIAHAVLPFVGFAGVGNPSTTIELVRRFTRPAGGVWIGSAVWVDCWNGCGGPFSGSSASIATRVTGIRIDGR